MADINHLTVIPYTINNTPYYINLTFPEWELIDKEGNPVPFIMDSLNESDKIDIDQYIIKMSNILTEQLGSWFFTK